MEWKPYVYTRLGGKTHMWRLHQAPTVPKPNALTYIAASVEYQGDVATLVEILPNSPHSSKGRYYVPWLVGRSVEEAKAVAQAMYSLGCDAVAGE